MTNKPTPAQTPTPWALCRTIFDGAVTHWHITGPKHGSVYPICNHTIEVEPDGSEQLANAAHIVRCVNSHDALVEALEGILKYENQLNEDAEPSQFGREIYTKARAALKLAKGE